MAWGVDGEFTMRRNREAYGWVGLVPRAPRRAGPSKPRRTSRHEPGLSHHDLAHGPPRVVPPTPRRHPRRRHAASGTPLIVSNVATFP